VWCCGQIERASGQGVQTGTHTNSISTNRPTHTTRTTQSTHTTQPRTHRRDIQKSLDVRTEALRFRLESSTAPTAPSAPNAPNAPSPASIINPLLRPSRHLKLIGGDDESASAQASPSSARSASPSSARSDQQIELFVLDPDHVSRESARMAALMSGGGGGDAVQSSTAGSCDGARGTAGAAGSRSRSSTTSGDEGDYYSGDEGSVDEYWLAEDETTGGSSGSPECLERGAAGAAARVEGAEGPRQRRVTVSVNNNTNNGKRAPEAAPDGRGDEREGGEKS